MSFKRHTIIITVSEYVLLFWLQKCGSMNSDEKCECVLEWVHTDKESYSTVNDRTWMLFPCPDMDILRPVACLVLVSL